MADGGGRRHPNCPHLRRVSVLRKADPPPTEDTRGLHAPWEGPFVIAKVLKPGTYKLANSQGEVYSNAWNIQQLHRFYP
jgi:hypothetical protein